MRIIVTRIERIYAGLRGCCDADVVTRIERIYAGLRGCCDADVVTRIERIYAGLRGLLCQCDENLFRSFANTFLLNSGLFPKLSSSPTS